MKVELGEALLLASRLLAYPDDSYLFELQALRKRCQELSESSASQFALACIDFIDETLAADRAENARRYVQIFDLSAPTSLFMTWHRYGNDRAQGQAMAALNGLYRTAGFEPQNPEMPDYLPRMLEFLAIGPDWACETLLDGFGSEIALLMDNMARLGAPHTQFLKEAIAPLRNEFPELFLPREGHDPTRRPMADPVPEPLEPLLPFSRK